MKLVTAIIEPSHFDTVKSELARIGVYCVTVSQVDSYMDHREVYRGTIVTVDLIPRIRCEVLCADEDADSVVDAIVDGDRTDIDDGDVVWVTTVDRATDVHSGRDPVAGRMVDGTERSNVARHGGRRAADDGESHERRHNDGPRMLHKGLRALRWWHKSHREDAVRDAGDMVDATVDDADGTDAVDMLANVVPESAELEKPPVLPALSEQVEDAVDGEESGHCVHDTDGTDTTVDDDVSDTAGDVDESEAAADGDDDADAADADEVVGGDGIVNDSTDDDDDSDEEDNDRVGDGGDMDDDSVADASTDDADAADSADADTDGEVAGNGASSADNVAQDDSADGAGGEGDADGTAGDDGDNDDTDSTEDDGSDGDSDAAADAPNDKR